MKTTIIPDGGGVTLEQIVHAERALGQKLPQSLRDFIKQTNGARTDPDWFVVYWPAEDGDIPELVQLHYVYPLETIVKETRALSERLPANTLAFGQDPGGDLLLMFTEGENQGAVRFWKIAYDHYGEGDNMDGVGIVASSLSEFLNTMERAPDFGGVV